MSIQGFVTVYLFAGLFYVGLIQAFSWKDVEFLFQDFPSLYTRGRLFAYFHACFNLMAIVALGATSFLTDGCLLEWICLALSICLFICGITFAKVLRSRTILFAQVIPSMFLLMDILFAKTKM